MTHDPSVMYASELAGPAHRYVAACRFCDWWVSDSSMAVVYAAARRHTADPGSHPEDTAHLRPGPDEGRG